MVERRMKLPGKPKVYTRDAPVIKSRLKPIVAGLGAVSPNGGMGWILGPMRIKTVRARSRKRGRRQWFCCIHGEVGRVLIC